MLRRVISNERAVSTIEVALALPVLAIIMLGLLQYGIVLHLSGGIRHALGEGIRQVKVYPNLSDKAILDYTRERLPAMEQDKITSFTIVRGTEGNARYGEITISYTVTPVVPFLPEKSIVLSETKRSYLPN